MSFFKKFAKDLSDDLDRFVGGDKKDSQAPPPPPGMFYYSANA